MEAEIIAVGSEMLTASGRDTNSLYLTSRLNSLGIEVRYKTIVGDDRDRMAAVIRTALGRSGLVILTGGLGPTEDDLTLSVFAEVAERPLRENAEIRTRIEQRFEKLGRPMPPNNLKQALVPEGTDWLENPVGSAPGIWFERNGVFGILLPGPPPELEAMFEASCMPRLAARREHEDISTRVYKVIGLPESEVDQRVAPIYTAYSNPVTTILAKPGEIEIHLRARTSDRAQSQALLAELGDKIELALGDNVYSSRGETLEEVVGMYLVMKQMTVAAAESCTGGLLSQRLTSTAGSSNYFLGGAVCYSNALKTRLAGVPAAVIEEHGAVSKQVARYLGEGIRKRAESSLGVGITGVAGPGGGTQEKPVGLVFVSVADARGTAVRTFRFPGNRERVRFWASQMALEMIRRRIRD